MSKRRTTKSSTAAAKPHRRSRGEIDRNYLFGDVLRKTGAAVAVAIGLIALYTPFSLSDAIREGMVQYLIVMGVFAAIGVVSYFAGQHLRHTATHWDFD